MLTSDRLKQLLQYDAETGAFTWRVSRGRCAAGSIAGYLESDGYWRISIDRRLYQAHLLAWLYAKGGWPEHEVDHENRIRSDNKWSNLRPATDSQNAVNSKTRGRTGRRGVRARANGNFLAAIWVNGKSKSLGTFLSAEEAGRVFDQAHQELHGEFSPKV